VFPRDKQFLHLIRSPPGYSYSQYMLNTTIHKQAQITSIRHRTWDEDEEKTQTFNLKLFIS